MGARLRTDFWVAALRRRAEAAGAYVSIARRGADEAGTVFLLIDNLDGCFDLYGPAPQSMFQDEATAERLFSLVASGKSEEEARSRIEQEIRFDTDLWLIGIEDRQGRHFAELAKEDPDARFTRR